MNYPRLVTGQSEKVIYEILRREGRISFEKIDSFFSASGHGKNLVKKFCGIGVAILENGFITFVPPNPPLDDEELSLDLALEQEEIDREIAEERAREVAEAERAALHDEKWTEEEEP